MVRSFLFFDKTKHLQGLQVACIKRARHVAGMLRGCHTILVRQPQDQLSKVHYSVSVVIRYARQIKILISGSLALFFRIGSLAVGIELVAMHTIHLFIESGGDLIMLRLISILWQVTYVYQSQRKTAASYEATGSTPILLLVILLLCC